MNLLARSVLLGALLLVGCSDDDDVDGPDGNPNANGSVTATANPGGSFSGVVGAAAVRSGTGLGFAATAISGSSSKTITFALQNVTASGTFQIGGNTSVNFASWIESPGGGTSQSWTVSAAGGTGSVIIQTLTSTRVTGTFNLSSMIPTPGSGATGNKAVTGSFDVAIQQQQ